ncbi:hypothetical protein [Prevotella sp. E13-27]|uniref:hypothetical protein n=1 Tax=Prevotella sp. E13-27 TaxID=2938122 RepID=UPI00200A08C9|nr:hypothetical protein [Prevotella sp. E13-27]MCK8622335.1 hypothetical protein [Prevotella sp. E13-27]
MAKGDDDPILLTDYKSNVILKRSRSAIDLELFTELYNICQSKGYDNPVIIPSTEYLNRLLLEKRDDIEHIGFQIPLCEESLYSKLSDKKLFEDTCRQYGISVPEVYDSITPDRIPFVIKPKSYFSQGRFITEKPKPILSIEDYERVKGLDFSNSYVQEFIGGDSYYLLCYFSKDGSYSVYSQENLIQQHDGLSIVGARSSNIHLDKRVNKYIEMLKDLHYHGLIMIEIRDYKGEFYMIEANPRLWGPSQLILDSNMDLFDRFACDNGFQDDHMTDPYKVNTEYFWFGGIVETQWKQRDLAFHNGYTYELMGKDLGTWLKNDIYKRKDSYLAFIGEITND